MTVTVSAETLAILKTIATSTLTTLLFKRGFRNVFLQGARPLKTGQRMAGRPSRCATSRRAKTSTASTPSSTRAIRSGWRWRKSRPARCW